MAVISDIIELKINPLCISHLIDCRPQIDLLFNFRKSSKQKCSSNKQQVQEVAPSNCGTHFHSSSVLIIAMSEKIAVVVELITYHSLLCCFLEPFNALTLLVG